MKKHVLIVLSLFLSLFIPIGTSSGTEVTRFGPAQYLRTNGAPNIYTDTFPATPHEGKLIVTNGDEDRKHKVSSALVFINGEQIFGPKDFKKKQKDSTEKGKKKPKEKKGKGKKDSKEVYVLEAPVNLRASNTISVELRSKPESYLTIHVTQEPPTVSFSAIPEAIKIVESSILSWSSTNAESVSIDNGIGSVPLSGSLVVSPQETTTYTITATGRGGTATASLTVTVVNSAPVAEPQSVTTNEDIAVSIMLTGSDLDGDPLTYQVTSEPSHGMLTGTPPDLAYSPSANYNGLDSFTFIANDGTEDSEPATVAITVTVVNDEPISVDDAATTDEDMPVTTSNVLANDTDVDGDTLSISGFTQPASGTVASYGDGTFTYTPNLNFNGTDSFIYTTSDGNGGTATAAVSIIVNPINDAPVATNQNVATNKNTTVEITLTAVDVEGDDLTYSIIDSPEHGQLSGTPPNLTYTPDTDFNGPDSLTFTANDGTTQGNTATAAIMVYAPVASILPQFTSPTNQHDVTFTINGTDISEYEYSVDGSAFSSARSVTETLVLQSLSEESHALRVIGKHSLGFWQTEADATIFTWVNDYTAPITTHSQSGGTFQTAFALTLSSNESATIYYTVDESIPTPGSPGTNSVRSPISLQIFKTITLKYFAVDEAGNAGPLKTESYLLDTDIPIITMTTPENGITLFTKRPRIELAFQDSSGINTSSVLFKVNDQHVTLNSTITGTSLSYTPASDLPEGKTILYVEAEDLAGNRTEKYFNFSIDTTPLVTTSSHPGGNINESFYLRLASNRPGTIYYTIDGSTPVKGASSTLSGTSPVVNIHIDQSLTVKFFAEDVYGNTESVKTIEFVFDTEPPAVTNTSIQENEHINNARPEVVIQYADGESGIDTSKIRFWINGFEKTASATITDSQLTYTPQIDLENDINTFRITLYDNTGNQSTLSRNFRVDTMPPVTTISPAANKYNQAQNVSLTANEAATIYYTLDGLSTISGPSPVQSIAVNENKTVKYFAVDLAGNAETARTAVFAIDLAAPQPPTKLSGVFKDVVVDLSWSANAEDDITGYNIYRRTDNTSYTKINAVPVPHQAGTITYQDTTVGQGATTTYAVSAVNDANNESGHSNSVAGVCVSVPPVITVIAPQNNFITNHPQLIVQGTTSDTSPISYVRVNNQDVATNNNFNTWTKEIALTEGENIITVIVEDEFGNQAQIQIQGKLDTTPPETTSSHESGIYNAALDVTLTSSESNALVYYTLDGSMPDTSNEAVQYATGSAQISEIDTSITIKFRSVDLAGNQEDVQTLELTIALTPPVISQIVPAEGQVVTATSRPTLSAQFSITTAQVSLVDTVIDLDGASIAAEATITQEGFIYTPTSDLSDGTHMLSISIKDEAGNEAHGSYVFTIDVLAPVTFVSPPGGWYSEPQTVTLFLNKPGIIYYTTDGTDPVPGSGTSHQAPGEVTLSVSENTVLKFFGVGKSGRQEQIRTEEYLFDATEPVITATSPENGEHINQAQPVVQVYYEEPEGGLNAPACIATIDEQPLTFTSLDSEKVTFSTPFALQDGEHALLTTLQNIAGKHVQEQAVFYVDTVATTTMILPTPGTYSSNPESENYMPAGISITFQTSEPSQTYYTLDGSEPAIDGLNTILYDQVAFNINMNTVIKYFSVDKAGNQAPISTANYVYTWIPEAVDANLSYADNTATLTWTHPGETVSSFNIYRIELRSGWDGADVVLFSQDWGYAQDNATINFGRIPDPDNNSWVAQFKLNDGLVTATSFRDTTIEAGKEYVYFVQAVGQNNEKGRIDPASWRKTYLSMRAAITGVSYAGGYYNQPIDLVLTSNTPAHIYYTTDGTEPNETSANAPSPVSLSLSADTIMKFFSVRSSNGMREDTKTRTYNFDYAGPVITSFSPEQNTFHNNKDIAITAEFADGKSGVDLDLSGFWVDGNKIQNILTETSLSYQQAWTEGAHEVKLTLFDKAGNSIAQTRPFTIDTIAPVTSIDPGGGKYQDVQTITLQANKDATIYYTLDGSEPVPVGGTTLQGTSPVTNITISENTTVKYFSKDPAGNAEAAKTAEFIIDNEAPVIISSYPLQGSTVATQDDSLTIIFTYGDNNAGINVSSIRLLDENNNNITFRASVTGDTLMLTIKNPASGAHKYTLIIEDNAGNTLTIELAFTVDSTVPVTVASIKGGRFSEPITVDLECSEPATIHYSTDGYPPFVGAANTTAGTAPVRGIAINSTTKLQFFAVDAAGNVESTKTEIYYFDELPESVVNLAAVYNQIDGRIELSWDPADGSPHGYYVYRVTNIQDINILNQSRADHIAPPQRLRLSQAPVAGNTYNDSDIIPGATYWYGATVVSDRGIEGPVSELASVEVAASAPAPDKDAAVERALAWVDFTQDEQGYWADDEGARMLATSQVLNALKLTGKDNAGIRQALFYLRGHYADNNDYLARKILTLHSFGQNVDEMANRLISQAKISSTYIYGWGMQKRYRYDAIDTALGTRAAECTTQDISQYNGGYYSLRTYSSLKSADGYYGWVPGKETSIYVSALVCNVINAPASDYQWIIDPQNPDGSFGNGVIDTAAVLLWLDVDEAKRSNAVNYLVSQQTLNGSWQDDAYLTGLCLEALLK